MSDPRDVLREQAKHAPKDAPVILVPRPVDRIAKTLTDGSPVTEDHREIDPKTGMQKGS